MKEDLGVNFGACIRGAKFNLPIALLEMDEASLDTPREEKCFATVGLAGPLRGGISVSARGGPMVARQNTSRPVLTLHLRQAGEFGFRMGLRELRLATGLVLGAFLLTHFSNHALGLISVEAMEAGRPWFSAIWRTPPATILLYGSLLVHFTLALQALYRRRTLRMRVREAAQLVLGLSLPFLLVAHVVGTRIDFAITGTEADYPSMLRTLWLMAP